MRLADYTQKREQTRQEELSRYRDFCVTCLRPALTCYCRHVQPFDPKIHFVILIHVREAQKRIATGRISHRCLENSVLLHGYNYSHDPRVNSILANPENHCVVLYPGANSANLTQQTISERAALFPKDKKLVVFVIDGTWTTARKIVQRSHNLTHLPRICFSPSEPSRFRLRKQPKENYCSTIEAIHHTLELLGPTQGFDVQSRVHDRLLQVFDHMVEQQIELASQYRPRFLGCNPTS